MTGIRLLAAVAAAVTALLLQATLVAPLSFPIPLSLPALLVTCVALSNGPAAGMSFGFGIGLLADLASSHPAGVLALAWTLLGLTAGTVANRLAAPGHRTATAVAAGLTTGATILASVLLTAVGLPGQAAEALRYAPAILVGHAFLGWFLTPVVSTFLHSAALRRHRAPVTAVAVIAHRRASATGTANDDVAWVQHG